MLNYSFYKIKIILILLTSCLILGCSFHYDKGSQLEKEKRWEEAAIEYRIALVEDPENIQVLKALNRVNIHVANENFESYKSYLQKKQYRKAFNRLEAALSQNPELTEARLEINHWLHVLITGKVEFEFNKLSSNLRLAEEMVLQVKINTPNGKILGGNISSETGIFFIEDLVYRKDSKQLAEYTVNSIGLKIIRKSLSGFSQQEFKKFVNFRELSPIKVSGTIDNKFLKKPQNVLDHRPSLLSRKKDLERWYPPSLLSYELKFSGNTIRVISKSKRNEFTPSFIYLNNSDRRVNLDFGVYQLRMDDSGQNWSIRRKFYRTLEEDYYFSLSRNIALSRYFFYDRILKFIK